MFYDNRQTLFNLIFLNFFFMFFLNHFINSNNTIVNDWASVRCRLTLNRWLFPISLIWRVLHWIQHRRLNHWTSLLTIIIGFQLKALYLRLSSRRCVHTIHKVTNIPTFVKRGVFHALVSRHFRSYLSRMCFYYGKTFFVTIFFILLTFFSLKLHLFLFDAILIIMINR